MEWNKARRYFALAGDQAGKIAGDSEALAHYKKAVTGGCTDCGGGERVM